MLEILTLRTLGPQRALRRVPARRPAGTPVSFEEQAQNIPA
jgi:hypothetical protein